MPRSRRKKTKRSASLSNKNFRPKDIPMKDIQDTASTVDTLIQSVAKMSAEERTRLSVILTHAMLGIGVIQKL